MDTRAIRNLNRQIIKVNEKMESLASGIEESSQGKSGLEEVYEDLILDELKHIQVLTLELTKLVTSDIREDDSVFSQGELSATPERHEESKNVH